MYSNTLMNYNTSELISMIDSKKPKIIFGMGGYASFPICIAASILKIKFIAYIKI